MRVLHGAQGSVLQGSGPLVLAGMAAVGLLVALLAVPVRVTPMLPVSVSLVLLGLTAVALVRMHLLERLPSLPGSDGALTALALGGFVPLAVVLAAPLFVGARWRASRDEEDAEEEEYFEDLYEEEPQRGAAAARAEREEADSDQHVPRHRA
nr:hypothetical protein [Nocardiopsis algeriensis]